MVNKNIMTNPKISVLMPIYNTEKYLDKALDSVRCQTLKDIEIICINDGSTDGSLDIIKKHAKEDDRIIIVNKKNSGYGDSMNKGLKKATGKYVAILEPDDWIESTMYADLYKIAEKNNSDVVKSNCWKYYGKDDKNELWKLIKKTENGLTVKPADNPFIFSRPPSIWSAIYRREFLLKNNIKFLSTPGASYQDTSFSFKIWAMAQKASFVKEAYLHYRQDDASSSINNVAKKMNNVVIEYDEVDSYLEKHKIWSKLATQAIYCRFLAYIWNIEYLPYRKMCEFIMSQQDKMKAYKNDGLIDKKLYTDKQYNNIVSWISHPILFAMNEQMRKMYHKLIK